MKQAVITMCSNEYRRLFEVTGPEWVDYCLAHNMTYIPRLEEFNKYDLTWGKIKFIEETLNDYDIVLWVGTDTIPTNKSKSLEDVWEYHAVGKPILLTSDIFGINSDVMIFKKHTITQMFLYAILNIGQDFYYKYSTHVWAEQEAIIRFAYQDPYRDSIRIASPNEGLNSYINSVYGRPYHWYGNWKPGDWILHLPALSPEERIELALKYRKPS